MFLIEKIAKDVQPKENEKAPPRTTYDLNLEFINTSLDETKLPAVKNIANIEHTTANRKKAKHKGMRKFHSGLLISLSKYVDKIIIDPVLNVVMCL